jgi:hypothetical protein
MRAHVVASTLATLLLAGVLGCSNPVDSAGPQTSTGASTTDAGPVEFDRELSDELIEMAEADQQGISLAEDRQARLAEILAEHGWPGHDLVGEEGSSAAWLIAQHADLDPDLQRRALELLTDAVAEDDASAGDLAYLTDRVAVASGEPQTYGTQIRCTGKRPVLPTPIADPDAVDELRAEAGLEPLPNYLEQMRGLCRKG